MKIKDDVYKIKGDSNIYLILNPRPTIIDTSDSVDRTYIISEIRKIIPPDNIKLVLLTHLHYDHAGNLEIFPNAKFYASTASIENYKKSSKDFFFYDISKANDKILRSKLNTLPREINGLKIIDCPGHTKGSVAFIDQKRKIVFSGDTLFENGIGRTDLPNSTSQINESVKKLKSYLDKGYTLCPGHDY